MLNKYKNVRLSDTFVNLTDEAIHTYEKVSGNVWIFVPESREIPSIPAALSEDTPIVHYIVNRRIVHALQALDRPLDDIVVVDHEHRGRDDIKIVYLAWAKDSTVPVCLYDGAHKVHFPHL